MKVILYLAQTINGYIARENDNTPWSKEVFRSYYSIVREAGNIIVGRKTHSIMKRVGEFKRCGNPFTVIVSRSLKKAAEKNTIVAKSPAEALRILKGKRFKRIIVGGGSRLATSFMRAGLIDDIYLDVEPRAFGRGVPLFQDSDLDIKLSLVKTVRLSKNTVRLHYRVL